MTATILILACIVLTAAWNGLVIKWHQTESKKISKAWHDVGFFIRALLVVLIYMQSGLWPAVIAAFIAWIPYNVIISLIAWKKWWYLSDTGIDGIIKRLVTDRVFPVNSIQSISEVKTGDTFLGYSDTFLGRSIRSVMRRWGKKKGYDTWLIPNHAARYVLVNKIPTPYLFGSIESGYKPIEWAKHYDWEKDKFVVMRRKTPLTESEETQTTRYCLHLVTVSWVYQLWNFMQWIMLVYLGIDTFRPDRDAFTYCYESERKARKDLNPDNYGDVSRTDIFDLLYDPNYELIFISEELRKQLF